MTEVYRTDTEHLIVRGKWFDARAVSQAAYDAVKAAGSKNPAFDMPPFCYTGCPYPDAILALELPEVDPPQKYRVMYVPHDGKKPYRGREPIWPQVFGLDQSLYEA
ncbi:MAG: hypothetical protein U5N55_12055 [Cypionkella sp.]|nr:hypothetical protein [Cypionkella sp.]